MYGRRCIWMHVLEALRACFSRRFPETCSRWCWKPMSGGLDGDAATSARNDATIMRIGYARVSTRRQSCALQIKALEDAGCSIVIAEKRSGRSRQRPGLAAAVALCQQGDELVAWKVDRFGRDLVQLVELMRLLEARGARPSILTGHAAMIDFDTAEGRALYGLFASIAEIEGEFGRDRTRAGLDSRSRTTKPKSETRAAARSRLGVAILRRPLCAAFNGTKAQRASRPVKTS